MSVQPTRAAARSQPLTNYATSINKKSRPLLKRAISSSSSAKGCKFKASMGKPDRGDKTTYVAYRVVRRMPLYSGAGRARFIASTRLMPFPFKPMKTHQFTIQENRPRYSTSLSGKLLSP